MAHVTRTPLVPPVRPTDSSPSHAACLHGGHLSEPRQRSFLVQGAQIAGDGAALCGEAGRLGLGARFVESVLTLGANASAPICFAVAATAIEAVRARRRPRCADAGRAGRLAILATAVSAERMEETGMGKQEVQNEEIVFDTTDWSSLWPKHEDMEKWVDGEKWIMVKDGKKTSWRKESDVGVYRYTHAGYESRDENGNWVNYAQMPQDVSHLTDAQRARLIKELRGEVKVSLRTEDDELGQFVPLPEVPPVEKWPFHEADIADLLPKEGETDNDHVELCCTDNLGQAFFLASRWKAANEARRHLGYNVNDELEDVAKLNGTVLAFREMVAQLKRLAKFRKLEDDEPTPSDAGRLQALRINGILGTKRGSALALWFYSDVLKRAFVDLCIGDDCMDQGPYAEEKLLRVLARTAAELGAETMWARTRRTESGMVFPPDYFPKLGFKAVPLDQQEDENWEAIGVMEQKREVVELVNGLNLWMSTRGLEHLMEEANQWCHEMGADNINEVAENKVDLADFLGDRITKDEREKLLRL